MNRRLLLKMPQGPAEAADLIAMLGDLFGLSAPEPMREAHEGLWCGGLKYIHTYRDDRGIIEILRHVGVSEDQARAIGAVHGVSDLQLPSSYRTTNITDMYVESKFSRQALEKIRKILDLG